MEFSQTPKILISLGVVLIIIGLVWQFLGPHLNLGKLPGDFSYEKENVKVYFPLATSILLSLVLSLIFWLFKKF